MALLVRLAGTSGPIAPLDEDGQVELKKLIIGVRYTIGLTNIFAGEQPYPFDLLH